SGEAIIFRAKNAHKGATGTRRIRETKNQKPARYLALFLVFAMLCANNIRSGAALVSSASANAVNLNNQTPTDQQVSSNPTSKLPMPMHPARITSSRFT